jgi:chemotaxis signal transduction protein
MLISHPKSRDAQIQQRLPFMVVRFPTLNLAFDMAQLQQVVPMPPVQYSPTRMLGLAQVAWGAADAPTQRSVIVVDLHGKLYDDRIKSPGHLLLFAALDGLLYGIPVAKLPEITTIPADRLLPQTDESAPFPALGLTRQLIKLPGPTGEQILFVVDLPELVQEVRAMAAA